LFCHSELVSESNYFKIRRSWNEFSLTNYLILFFIN